MIDIDAYYDYTEMTEKLERLATSPVVELDAIGEPRWTELGCTTVAGLDGDEQPDERPGALVTANVHAREYAGSWTSLVLLDRLPRDMATIRG